MKNFFLKLGICALALTGAAEALAQEQVIQLFAHRGSRFELSLIHISEPTRH